MELRYVCLNEGAMLHLKKEISDLILRFHVDYYMQLGYVCLNEGAIISFVDSQLTAQVCM